jgi:hypothetical protein
VGNLPESRTTTLTPGDPVPSALINEIQDNIVGGFRRVFSRTFRPVLIYGTSSPFTETLLGISGDHMTVFESPAGATLAQYYVSYEDGDRVIGFGTPIRGDGAVDVTMKMYHHEFPDSAVADLLGSVSEVNVPNSFHTIESRLNSLTPFVPKILASGHVLFGTVQSSNTGMQFSNVTVYFDRLP